MLEFKIVEHMSFDWMVVAYFFLGGISAGSFIFSVIANFWKKEFQPLAKTAAIIAPITLALGMLVLLVDLGQPFRFWRLMVTLVPTSALSWGVWFLNIFFVFSLLYAYSLVKGESEKSKKFAYLGLPFSILVGTYTGILLAQAPGRALWHSPLIPVLFMIGGLISGIALVILVSAGAQDNDLLAKLGRCLAKLVILEVALILVELIVLLNGGIEASSIAKILLIGEYSFLFWIVEIILGAAVPVFILLRGKITVKAQAIASMLVLIGIYTMRYIVVIGGQVPTF